MIKALSELFRSLCSNTDPGAIAHAVSCGIILGFVPKDNLLWYILFVFILFMRIQRSVYGLCIILGSLLAGLLDPVFDQVGYWALTLDSARDAYVWLLNVPFVAFTKFNNTVVMGSLLCGLIAYIPFYGISRAFIFVWRKYLAESARNLKIVKIMKHIPLIAKLADLASGR